MNLTRKYRRGFVLIAAVIVFATVIAGVKLHRLHQERSYQSGLACVEAWARVAPLPAGAAAVNLDVRGSMFTREFVLTFEAPREVIEAWLKASPGPCSVTGERLRDAWIFHYDAGDGASYAEVIADYAAGWVFVRTYWS